MEELRNGVVVRGDRENPGTNTYEHGPGKPKSINEGTDIEQMSLDDLRRIVATLRRSIDAHFRELDNQ